MTFLSSFSTKLPVQALSLKLAGYKAFASSALFALGMACSLGASAQSVPLAQAPMLTLKSAPGLVMLTMGRDLPLYKAAYNDVNDIDGDGFPDIFFKPTFKYEGYFAYDRCYTYASNVFTPAAIGTAVVVDASDLSKNYYRCSGQWSGNFLNWVTMARIDVLRKVLYGGNRSTDGTTTVLERTYVPQDSTLWGKEYTDVATDGYNITQYTPLALPTAGRKHMFANTTLASAGLTGVPLMITYENRSGRIWDLVAQEAIILGANPTTTNTASAAGDSQPSATRGTVTRYTVRVSTCVLLSGKYEDWCTGYPASAPTAYKPTGLLHKYGEAKTLAFGLISGTYDNNYAGGVLRQNIDDFSQEVNQTNGRFNTTVKGIVYHLNRFKPLGFDTAAQWNCGSFTSLPPNASCPAWGNPLGEMMFEGLQYFAAGTPTPAFAKTETIANNATNNLALQQPAWVNPYVNSASRANTTAYPKCARPIQMTIGDPKTSFDSDHLPGAAFSVGTTPNMGTNSTPTLASLNVSNEADAIWLSEFSGATKKFFIGEVIGNADGNPSAKTVSSFKNIRGHGPDATTNQGSFYGASVARYGKYTGVVNPAVGSTALRVDQVSIALDSHVPQIKIPLPSGKTVSIVLLSKSVNLYSISNAKGAYQQTGAITAFFIDKLANTNAGNMEPTTNGGRPYYKFRISFSDADQGNDNESDAKVTYEIKVTAANTLTVGVDYFEGSNGIEMHQGYVISGTTNDGVYLDVGGAGGFRGPTYGNAMLPPAVGYYLDTMPGQLPGSAMNAPATGPNYTNIASRLPNTTLAAPRAFTAGASASANGEFVPHDMLWYAAKYGSATGNYSGNGTFKLKPNGDPENYYLVNNPSTLAAQMGQAFQKAASLAVATGSAVASNGTKVAGGSLVYQAGFDSEKWGGELRAFTVQSDGNIGSTPVWLATAQQPVPASRTMVLGQGGTAKVTITPTSYAGLTVAEQAVFKDDVTLKYLLGTRTSEKNNGGALRDRTSAMGDIVNSDPLYIGKSDFGYTDASYTTFKAASDPQLVAVGSNDGSYRLISAPTGVEKLAFFPKSATPDIAKLSDPSYTHQYYVDGPSAFGHVRPSALLPWKSVVAASLGAGGKAVFALNASATNFATNGVLWELAGGTTGLGQYLGNVVNKPVIGQLDNDVGAVFIGNGINSNDDRANLLILNAETGASIRTCTMPGNITGNGMSSIAAVSTSNTGKIDLIYAADYKGNIWRMLPNDSSCVSGAVKVFTAKNSAGVAQAITGELTVIKAPNSKPGYMILFGTGKYSASTDPANTDVQSLYGVWDDPASPTGSLLRTNLLNYPISGYNTTNLTRSVAAKADVNAGKAWYEAPSTKSGWVVDLTCSSPSCPVGERFVDKATLVGTGTNQIAYFLSIVPGVDVCQVGGGGWVTGIDPNTGAYTKAFASVAPNSAYVGGVTPRGLFIVSQDPSGSTPGKEYLYVTRNFSTGSSNAADSSVSPAFNQVSGGTTNGADGSGTTSLGTEIPCPTCTAPSASVRRQVWRQIQ